MKTYLKRLLIPILSGLIVCSFYSCNSDDEHTATPIAPILKEIKFPSENDIIPGQVAQINGLGFAKEDIVYLSNADNQKEKVEVTEITDSYLKFIVPVEAGGEYTVTIERAGKQTVLNGTFKVPFVVPIIDIVLPSGNVQPKSKVEIQGKGFEAGEKQYTYRLSSMTCLAGDVIGDYSFEQPIRIGDQLVFEDMAIYSMVKNNTFNGMPLPGIALLKEDGSVEMVREFGYDDFKMRL